ncbi:beta-microseminoprotein-like [Gracilinanus agilis]|uniref:beta-microseminoprotein-like n=1 Tax=Gracilinanus agilis TaxID=191870 RepID=UPI001CFCBEE7|nr:beta-microseminoprotein-like [Gracilinanus agilis]
MVIKETLKTEMKLEEDLDGELDKSLSILMAMDKKNTVLGVLLTWTIIVTLCDAQCTFIWLESTEGNPPKGCKDAQGVLHPFHANWKSGDCEICACTNQGIECCVNVKRPALYDKYKCMEVFHKESCTYRAVEKENPSKVCEMSIYIG